MTKRLLTLCTLLGVFAITTLPTARAVVIFDTYGGNDSGTSSQLSASLGKGIGFTMPGSLQPVGTTSYTLDSVSVRLSGSAASSQIVFSLYTSVGNKPGSLITSLNATTPFTLTGSTGIYAFNPASAVTLSAGTTYWVTMTMTGSSLFWKTSSPQPASYSTVGVTVAGGYFGSSSNPAEWDKPSTTYNSLTISATAVPEPGMTGLALLGATGIAAVWRRRARG